MCKQNVPRARAFFRSCVLHVFVCECVMGERVRAFVCVCVYVEVNVYVYVGGCVCLSVCIYVCVCVWG